jgi:Tol biopolymer transport system component
MPISPGTKLGPYEVITLVGAGGMGSVYRARDARLGRDVAVKVIRGVEAADADRLRRFEQEARAAGILNHPNVLTIYDIGTHEGAPYLVSELLEGRTIRLCLAEGPLPSSKVLEYAIQIADGLAAAHAKGIVHRDLKPENLFLTKEGRVKILDFGLAKLTQPDALSGFDSEAATVESARHFVGTVSYMSPEQIRAGSIDHRSDIFSFGTVVYEMLTGERAFHGGSAIETMNAALKEDPPRLLSLPVGLDLIVQHCLEKDPGHRFQSAPDLAFHMKALPAGSTSRRIPALAQSVRRRVSLRGVLLGTAALCAVAGAFLVGTRFGRSMPPAFHQLTFRRGTVQSARFGPDGQTVVYGAAWDGQDPQVFTTRPESPESRSLGLPEGDVLAVSRSGELALSLGRRAVFGQESRGTLARVPFSGGAPREVLADVESADWGPDGQDLAVIRAFEGHYRLEYPIGQELYAFEGWLSHVRVSPRGDRIGFIEHPVHGDDRGDVCVVDRDGRNRKTLSAGWSSANGLAWSDDGRELWFTASDLGPRAALYAVDTSGTNRLVARTPGRLALRDVRGGRALLTESRLRLRAALHQGQAAASEDRDLSWLDGSLAADLSADGRLLLLAEQGAGVDTRAYVLYLRRTDGTPALRLGEGSMGAISPDERSVLGVVQGGAASLRVLPTGAGEARPLEPGPVVQFEAVAWFPGGEEILFAGREPKHDVRVYVQGLRQGQPRAISPEGLGLAPGSRPVSPDGQTIIALDSSRRVVLLGKQGGAPRFAAGLEPGDRAVGWSTDGRAVYAFRQGELLPAKVYRVSIEDGSKQLVAEIAPADRAGASPLVTLQVTPDGGLFSYTYSQTLSDLYLVEALR